MTDTEHRPTLPFAEIRRAFETMGTAYIQAARRATRLLRAERHPDDPDRKADEQ